MRSNSFLNVLFSAQAWVLAQCSPTSLSTAVVDEHGSMTMDTSVIGDESNQPLPFFSFSMGNATRQDLEHVKQAQKGSDVAGDQEETSGGTRNRPIAPKWAGDARHLEEFRSEDSGDGASPIGRIVGGQEVVEDRYPFLATLFKRYPAGNLYQLCAGALIAPDLVLSAAHCKDRVNHVHLGRHDLSQPDSHFESFDIIDYVAHPGFVFETFDYDFIIFKLSGKSTFPTVKINRNEWIPATYTYLNVIGWGLTENGGRPSSVPNEVRVQYQENNNCQRKYRNEDVTDNMLCAASSGKDACQGDSGGPLIAKGQLPSEDLVVGLVSWGYACADPYHPGVYSRVSYVTDWVDETACTMSPGSCTDGTLDFGTKAPSPRPTPRPTPWPTPRPTPRTTPRPTPQPSRRPTRRPNFHWYYYGNYATKRPTKSPTSGLGANAVSGTASPTRRPTRLPTSKPSTRSDTEGEDDDHEIIPLGFTNEDASPFSFSSSGDFDSPYGKDLQPLQALDVSNSTNNLRQGSKTVGFVTSIVAVSVGGVAIASVAVFAVLQIRRGRRQPATSS